MPDLSVIIPTYRYDNFPNLEAAVWSLRNQTVVPEIVVVVGGDIHLYKQAKLLPVDTVLFDPDNEGACHARNIGAEKSHGTVVAFLDDDEVAAPNWCAELWKVYQNPSRGEVGGVGGKNVPLWECGPPSYLPEEFYWLIGCTHKGFSPDGDDTCQVRNTFAGNISFRRDVFARIGGFRSDIGFSNGKLIQGEEPEICDRMCDLTGLDFWYNPKAVIYNRVPPEKVRIGYLLRRAYWQGVTKRGIQQDGHSLDTERDQLTTITSGILSRISQAVMLGLLTGVVGIGYLRKVVR